METNNISIIFNGMQYAGFKFDELPLDASKAAACQWIDQAADTARANTLGDPLRTMEYQKAESDALAFQAAGYQGEVPASVQSAVDATNQTAQAAADSIIKAAASYTQTLLKLRDIRLKAKAMVGEATIHATVEDICTKAITATAEIGKPNKS